MDFETLDTTPGRAVTRVVLSGRPYVVITEDKPIPWAVTGKERYVSIRTGPGEGRQVSVPEFIEAYRRADKESRRRYKPEDG